MPTGTKADFKLYDEQFFGGQIELLAQNLNGFNAASNGAILLDSRLLKGEYARQSFMQQVAGIAHRDPASVAAVADQKLTQGENVSPKVNKRFGPFADTLDAWKKIGESPELFSFYLGKMVAEQKMQNMLNTSILAVEAALQGVAALNHAVAATATHGALVQGMAKLGDKAGNIVAWVTHSKPYFDLVGQAITDKIFGVANVVIYEGNVATLGKPTVVIDAPALYQAGAPDTYVWMGLQAGAVRVTESEQEDFIFEKRGGQENIIHRFQSEYAYNVEVKGMTYNVAGGVNPTDATLGTPANWVKTAASDKNLPGVRIQFQ